MTNQDGSVFVVQYKTVDDDASSNFEESSKHLPENSHENQPQQPGPPADVGQSADKDILESFISGSNCLTGVWFSNFQLFQTFKQDFMF